GGRPPRPNKPPHEREANHHHRTHTGQHAVHDHLRMKISTQPSDMPRRPNHAHRFKHHNVVQSAHKQIRGERNRIRPITFWRQPTRQKKRNAKPRKRCQPLVYQRQRRLHSQRPQPARRKKISRPVRSNRNGRRRFSNFWHGRSRHSRHSSHRRSPQFPSACSTTGNVLSKILKSNPKLHLSMYSKSSAIFVSNDGSRRAVTCHNPVTPGFTSNRRKSSAR